jgi:hypothetical protein
MLQDIIFSDREKDFFQYLFFNHKDPNSEYIEGSVVANLFTKARLDNVNKY